MTTTRKTMVAVNTTATRGERFPCEAFRHVRRISWTGDDVPKTAQAWRDKAPSEWGGAALNAKDYAVLFDGTGQGPSDEEVAQLIGGIQYPGAKT